MISTVQSGSSLLLLLLASIFLVCSLTGDFGESTCVVNETSTGLVFATINHFFVRTRCDLMSTLTPNLLLLNHKPPLHVLQCVSSSSSFV